MPNQQPDGGDGEAGGKQIKFKLKQRQSLFAKYVKLFDLVPNTQNSILP